MSLVSLYINYAFNKSDKKRDAGLEVPEDVTVERDIAYMPGGKYHLLDVYYPKKTKTNNPVIMIVHGGGFVYGTKEVYQYYGMSLARQGFTVVNFNYTLAPKKKFPTQHYEISRVMDWMVENNEDYFLDLDNVFMVGDSAGANLASHFVAIYSNDKFAKLFDFEVTQKINLKAIALNCGMYDISYKSLPVYNEMAKNGGANITLLLKDYLGKKQDDIQEQLSYLDYIDSNYPSVFVMTSSFDFLKELNKPMHELLLSRGVDSRFKLYGDELTDYMTHVFHCNMKIEEAHICNKEQCDFFKEYM